MSARQRLAAFMRWKKWSPGQVASAAGLDRSTVAKILDGTRSAGLAVARAIEDVTGDWNKGPIRSDEWLPRRRSVAHATALRPRPAGPSSSTKAA